MQQRGSLLKSFACAATGIVHALRAERNVKIHTAATIMVFGAAFGFHITPGEWCMILLAIGLVWTAELLNTSIEAVVDLVSPDEDELARIAKDTSSGGVLIAAIASVAVGVIVFGPRLWAMIS
ncbi:MAG: diacylglycerol kinase family protein [Planctomycetaceae bacterium]|nr:diacylglycerol kinase family protein [Planctomycetaceae bacterium]